MPSLANADRPFTLICPARSGSSLLQAIFAEHPECQAIGETADLVFSAWYGLVNAEFIIVRNAEQRTHDGYLRSAGAAIRAMLVSFSPSDKPCWMQKPIGLPAVFWLFGKPPDFERFAEFYWGGFESIFPGARCFTILRDPRDVVLSSTAYFGVTQEHAWQTCERIYRLLLHDGNRLGHAVDYEMLIQRPRKELKRLFAFLGLPWSQECLKAFDFEYVRKPPADRSNPKGWSYRQPRSTERPQGAGGFSRAAEWGNLAYSETASETMALAARLWERFGKPLPAWHAE